MLADVASKAQDAALAQLEVDTATVGADKATDIYLGTLEAQRQAFIDSALEAGYNADEVQALADKVFALPDEKQIKFLADTAAAATTIDNFMTRYGTLRGTIVYRATREGSMSDGAATGGFANGGEIPGTPSRKDNVLIHAATGEFVVNTEAAQRNKALLHYINSGGRIRGYADGGEVQPQYAAPMPRWGSGGGAVSTVDVTQIIQPAPGMSEAQIARIAAERMAFAARGN
jgi:hypothetical protein